MTLTEYAEVTALRQCIAEFQLRFEVLPARAPLSDFSWREIIIYSQEHSILLPVDDDHRDAERGPVAQMQLILATCECFEEESASLAQWCQEAEVPNNEHGAEVFQILAERVPQVRAIVGHTYEAISTWDIELNTGIAEAMRNA